jgi:hypothetical protein
MMAPKCFRVSLSVSETLAPYRGGKRETLVLNTNRLYHISHETMCETM